MLQLCSSKCQTPNYVETLAVTSRASGVAAHCVLGIAGRGAYKVSRDEEVLKIAKASDIANACGVDEPSRPAL